MDELMKMMTAKKSGAQGMSDEEITAKEDVIKELLQMALSAMGDHVKGGMDEMSKVSVSAADPKDLAMGLDKAKEVVSNIPADDESTEDAAEEATETPAEEKKEDTLEEDAMPFGSGVKRKKSLASMMSED